MTEQKKLEVSLLLLRLGVFVVMLMWTLDKLINPGHAAAVASKFYGMPEGTGAWVFYAIGFGQLLLVLAFVAGFKKRLSYSAILLMHTVSTLSSFPRYIEPWSNLLFFAAFPMLAACIALYLLRDSDRMLSVS